MATRTPEQLGPSPEVRVGRWHEFDVAGAGLPSRTIAAHWTTSRITLGICESVGAFGLLWALARISGWQILLGAGVLGFGAELLVGRFKKNLYRRAVGEENPSDPIVAVSYRIGEYEYGRDVGRLCVEGGWLFFEGERSSFSLGQRDVLPLYAAPIFGVFGRRRTSLQILHARRNVTIELDPISVSPITLRNFVSNWRLDNEPTEGIALLPPMEPSSLRDFTRSPQWGKSISVGWAGATIVYYVGKMLLTVDLLTDTLMPYSFGAFVLGVVIDRIRVHFGRKASFRLLSDIRGLIEERGVKALDDE